MPQAIYDRIDIANPDHTEYTKDAINFLDMICDEEPEQDVNGLYCSLFRDGPDAYEPKYDGIDVIKLGSIKNDIMQKMHDRYDAGYGWDGEYLMQYLELAIVKLRAAVDKYNNMSPSVAKDMIQPFRRSDANLITLLSVAMRYAMHTDRGRDMMAYHQKMLSYFYGEK